LAHEPKSGTRLKISLSRAEQQEKEQEKYGMSNKWETTASEAQKLAKSRIQQPSCIDIGRSFASASNGDEHKRILFHSLYGDEAITHWSGKLKNDPLDSHLTLFYATASKPFARSSAIN
jgi:hypothetical protein